MADLHAALGREDQAPPGDDGGATKVGALFRDRYPEMVRLANLLGADDPEDIAQEAFARLIRRHDSLRDPAAALAYVRTSVCFPAAGWPAVTGLIGSGNYWAGDECFGYVHAGVARVVIRLHGGYQTAVSSFRPGWPGSGVRFFALVLPRSLFSKLPQDSSPQGTVTAYDAAGHVMATEPLIGTGS